MMQANTTSFRGWQVAMLLLLATFILLQSTGLHSFGRDYDEGVYLAEAHLVSSGYTLYREVGSASAPLFIWSMAAIFEVLGEPSVLAARFAIVLFGALGLLAIGAIASTIAPIQAKGTGFFAALLLLALPRWLLYGQIAMADIPSLSLSLVAIALALQSWQKGRAWIVAGGIAAGLALGMKLLATYTLPLLAVIVLLRYNKAVPFTLSRFVLDGLAAVVGVAIPLLLALPWLDLPSAYEFNFRYHWEAGREWVNPQEALRLMGVFHWEHLGWVFLALLGFLLLVRERAWRSIALLAAWELLVIVMLSQHAPLWGHLLLPLAPPIILAGALVPAHLLSGSRPLRRPFPALAAIALLVFTVLWPRALRADHATIVPPEEQALLQEEIVPWVQQVVSPDQMMLTDDPMVAVRAGRLISYDMTDTSFTRIASDFLNSSDLIEASERDRPAVILFWSDRFRALEDWQQWVSENYIVARQVSDTRVLYIRPDLQTTP